MLEICSLCLVLCEVDDNLTPNLLRKRSSTSGNWPSIFLGRMIRWVSQKAFRNARTHHGGDVECSRIYKQCQLVTLIEWCCYYTSFATMANDVSFVWTWASSKILSSSTRSSTTLNNIKWYRQDSKCADSNFNRCRWRYTRSTHRLGALFHIWPL